MTKAKTAAERDFATAEINFNAGADESQSGVRRGRPNLDAARRAGV